MIKLKQFLGYSLLLSAISTSAHAQFVSPIEVINEEGQVVELEAQKYMIKYRSKTDMVSTIGKMNGEVKTSIDNLGIVSAVLPISEVSLLKEDPNVEYIEIDHPRYTMTESVPFGIELVQAPEVSAANVANQKVCVIDTGYDITHIDLPSSGVTGDDFGAATGPWNTDGDRHGTHVTGTVAAIGGNDEGVVGVVPTGSMPLHIVKIFDDDGEFTSASSLVRAVNDCMQAGATVISMSLGGPGSSTSENNVFENAYAQGILSVAAAGNDGDSSLSYPASYDNVISVAAIDSSRNHASYSQANFQVELAAPGTGVQSTTPGNQYSFFTGTSMATPHVSGVAALVWSNYPQCTNQQIRNALAATAEDQGTAGRDNFYGVGIVQAKAAFDLLAQGCAAAPALEIPEPPERPTFDPELDNGERIEGMLANNRNENYEFFIDVPEGATNLEVVINGNTGDADLYISEGVEPTTNSFDCRSISPSSNESCTFAAPNAARYHILVHAFSPYDGLSLVATFDGGVNEDPVSSFTYSCDGLTCTFDGSSSSDSDGNIVSYSWVPERGVSLTGETVSYTYAEAGTYNVGLTVRDDDGGSHGIRQLVTAEDPDSTPNEPPVAAISYTCDGLTCQFDGASSTDADGDVVEYFWRPEPGQPGISGVTTSYTYSAAGRYSARLNVTDNDGDKHGVRVFIDVEDPASETNEPPVAAISYSCNGLTCDFDGASSTDTDGQIVKYFWRPEPGQPGINGVTTSYTYPAAGRYSARLNVTDDDDARDGARVFINVEDSNAAPNEPPVASFTYVCNGLTCNFDGTSSTDSDGFITEFFWRPQPGQPGDRTASPSTTHTYPAPGRYSARLNVTDNEGERHGVRVFVNVN